MALFFKINRQLGCWSKFDQRSNTGRTDVSSLYTSFSSSKSPSSSCHQPHRGKIPLGNRTISSWERIQFSVQVRTQEESFWTRARIHLVLHSAFTVAHQMPLPHKQNLSLITLSSTFFPHNFNQHSKSEKNFWGWNGGHDPDESILSWVTLYSDPELTSKGAAWSAGCQISKLINYIAFLCTMENISADWGHLKWATQGMLSVNLQPLGLFLMCVRAPVNL